MSISFFPKVALPEERSRFAFYCWMQGNSYNRRIQAHELSFDRINIVYRELSLVPFWAMLERYAMLVVVELAIIQCAH